MSAWRCNACLSIWLMHEFDDEAPMACPYCGERDSFSGRTGCQTIDEAVLLFAEEERSTKEQR